MDVKGFNGDSGGPDTVGGPSTAPTLDQVYAAIMSQKRKAQELPPAPAALAEPALRFRSGLGASLRNGTLEQLLFQGLGAAPEDGHVGPLSIMRSNTMENILRETLSSGRELHDLMVDWSKSLPEEKFAEGLANDMHAIDAAPPDVSTMRRTFTLERILSGAETDLFRANSNQQQHPHQQQPQQSTLLPPLLVPPSHHRHPQTQHPQGPLHRQLSGSAATSAATAAAGAGAGAGADAPGSQAVLDGEGGGQALRSGGGRAAAERLQRQESLHRLAASSGPGQPPRPASGSGVSNGHMGPPSSRGPGPGGMLRAAAGPGRLGPAAAVAWSAEEDAQSRSPKRHKAHHLVKSEAATHGSGLSAPDRTWSASLLDLAKAAAALDGRDLDDDPAPESKVGEGLRNAEVRQTRPQTAEGAAAGTDATGPPGVAPEVKQEGWRATVVAAATSSSGLEGSGAGEAGGVGQRPGAAGVTRAGGRDSSVGPGASQGLGQGGQNSGLILGCGVAGSTDGGGGCPGAAGVGVGPLVSHESAAAIQLLRSLSGVNAPGATAQGQGHGQAQAAKRTGPPQPASAQELKLLAILTAEKERLQREQAGLTGQLEAVMSQVEVVQLRNARMKQMLLDACHAKGIQADMELLNVSLQHHRAQPMGEAQAAHVAATVLGLNGGDVLATVQQLVGIALLHISSAPDGVGPLLR